ncbi:MAG: LysR family transcriptional regulator [Selenomonadaceae bacterium]|nr:LysR family transcriptional regulator [Selenomonadaceae bacterium]
MLQPYIKAFLQVAKSGSFSAAALELYITKVSVMNQINSLEAHIGVPLFERTSQGVFLTEAGRAFQKSAEKIMRLSEKAMLEVRELSSSTEQTIRIGTSMMRPATHLVNLWDVIKEKPEVHFDMVSFHDGASGLNQMLKALGDKIDCFVSPCGSTELFMNYSFQPFGACKVCVAMSRKHKLAKKKILRWEDLEEESLMLLKRGESYVLDELRDDILSRHPSINIVDIDGYYDISSFNLCEKHGYLMETLDIWEKLHPLLVTLPVKWKYEMPYGILYAKEPSDTVRTFVEAINSYVTAMPEHC